MTLVWIAVGAFIGWNLPQPFWAVAAQKFVEAKWEEFKKK
jgi:type III secretory pathway component EscT